MADIVALNNAILTLQAAAQNCLTISSDETTNPNYDSPIVDIVSATTKLNNIAAGLPPLPDVV